jgi:hypothetical protein
LKTRTNLLWISRNRNPAQTTKIKWVCSFFIENKGIDPKFVRVDHLWRFVPPKEAGLPKFG